MRDTLQQDRAACLRQIPPGRFTLFGLVGVKATLGLLMLAAIAWPASIARTWARRRVATPSSEPQAAVSARDRFEAWQASVSPRLRWLARQAALNQQALSRLRAYARQAATPEERALASLAVGYREYAARDFERARVDLAGAAEGPFADAALYYQASAALESGHAVEAANLLVNFDHRFPASIWQPKAVELNARTLLELHQPGAVIELLAGQLHLQWRPSLALLLAEAFAQAQDLTEAAAAYEQIYYSWPVSAEAPSAGQALRKLARELGPAYPPPAREMLVGRAAALLAQGQPSDALAAYDELIRTYPADPELDAWKLCRARCLIRLGRTQEAIACLSRPAWSPAESDAARLELLLEAQAQSRDEASISATLADLARLYPASPSYAAALASVARFYAFRGDWRTAATYGRSLIELFPTSKFAPLARWRVAWASVLAARVTAASSVLAAASERARDHDAQRVSNARSELARYVERYPDSAHTPAALYWLGRLADQTGLRVEARAFYTLLESRFANSFYALAASKRLRTPVAPARFGTQLDASPDHAADGRPTLPAELAARIPLPPTPSPALCPFETHGSALQPLALLGDLSLPGLARQYFRLMQPTDSAEATRLLVTLARIQFAGERYAAALVSARQAVPDYPEYAFRALPREIWEMLYPRAYWPIVERQARANRLDPYFVMAVIRQESAFNPRATSSVGARGLMQMLPGTARTLAPRRRTRRGRRLALANLYDPMSNIRLSCLYLRDLLRAFNGDVAQALAAYNAGEERVRQWLTYRAAAVHAASAASAARGSPLFIESIPFADTRFYVESVFRDQAIYRRLFAGGLRFRECRNGEAAR